MTRMDLEAECKKFGFRPPLVKFDIGDVPQKVREFAPYAEVWGNNSEDIRYEVLLATPDSLKAHLREVLLVPEVQDRFDAWLAGPEADRRPISEAYLAFTCLRMSAQEM